MPGDTVVMVHKANAQTFNNKAPKYRPPRQRPMSALINQDAIRRLPPGLEIPGFTEPKKKRPQSAPLYSKAMPKLEFPEGKSNAQKTIDGEFGPAMNGVSSYPYSRNQLLYLKDFRVLVAGTITHPYMVTAGKGASTPHDVLSGSNFDDDKLGGFAKKWRSEYRVQYTIEKDDFGTRIAKAKSAAPCGVRSEQYIA